ncbi:MAG: 50S ribosomal protein L11 methyltransferase [Desulfobulbaceae bacterium]|nr:50S ribosomal protein L11 methyltransferase [Desulfobulbaceae bacterium]HIJ79952.1 50S ribosomal protein L11 methyltransferase [Deltaproteobacteria bacterium]
MSHKHQDENLLKTWRKIIIEADEELADPIAGFLGDIVEGGIEQISMPATSAAPLEQIIGYIPNDQTWPHKNKELAQFLDQLLQILPNHKQPTISTEIIPDQDWNITWKKHFKPFHITSSLVIKPTWEPYTPTAAEKIIEMDPGMAFGTGHHASTKLALEFIENYFAGNPTGAISVLDVGTGTGILAMAAVLFGAARATAIDNDEDAVTVAGENIALNNLDHKIEAGSTPLDQLPGQYELVIANIIHDTLIELAPSLYRVMAPKGKLILAGILAGEQTDNIGARYQLLGLNLEEIRYDGEWSSLFFSNN